LSCYRSNNDNVLDKALEVVPVLRSNIAPDTVFGGFDIRCFGENANIDLLPVGGDYRYNYAIDWRKDNATGDTLQQAAYVKGDVLRDLVKGSYYYTITDTLGCFHDSTKVMIEPDLLQVVEGRVENPDCYGDGYFGSIYIDSIAGGAETYDYNYLWLDTGGGDIDIDNTTRNLIDIPKSDYRLTVTDANSCQVYYYAELLIANPFTATIVQSIKYGNYDVSCKDSSDAFIRVDGNGFDTPFDFTWYDKDKNVLNHEDTISNRPAGTYYYQVTDKKGCQTGIEDEDSIIRIEVLEPPPITFERDINDLYPGAWDISCFGESTGKLSISYTGGHTDYLDNTFNWTTTDGSGLGQSDSVQLDLIAGSYNVEVTDFWGCANDSTFTLEEPDQITYTPDMSLNNSAIHNISCFGESDGEINLLNLSGGGPKNNQGDGPEDYTYMWTPPAGVSLEDSTLQNQIGLAAGIYTVTVTDTLDCSVQSTHTLTEPELLVTLKDSSLHNEFEISCNDGSDGWISISPQGGERPYLYDWSDGVGAVSDTLVENLQRGEYSVILTDANGCIDSVQWTIEHPDTITLTQFPTDLIDCYGDTSTIHIIPGGGVGGYIYEWEGYADIDSALNGVEDGTYYVTVEDANGCIFADSFYLGQRNRIIPEIIIKSREQFHGADLSCFGASDASIEFRISGGDSTGYTRLWSSEDGPDLSAFNGMSILNDLPAATYTIQGVDAARCFYDSTFTLIPPSPVQIALLDTISPLCYGATDGIIRFEGRGGTQIDGSPKYNYSFERTDSLAVPEFLTLGEGIYELAVTDANLCSDTMDIRLTPPGLITVEFDTIPAECPDESNASLFITSITGAVSPYTINGGLSRDFLDQNPGEFIINIVDAHKCFYIDTVIIESVHSSCLDIPNAFTPNGDGANDVWRLDEDDNGSDMYLYPDAELTIINRWGEVIYFSNDVANEPWDGTYKGRALPVDSYYYMLDLKNGDPVITGNVTIVRDGN